MLRAVLIVCMVMVSLASVGGAVVPHHAEHCLTSAHADADVDKAHAGHAHSQAHAQSVAADADLYSPSMDGAETACPQHSCVGCIEGRDQLPEAPQNLSMVRILERIYAVNLSGPDGPLRPPRV
ncbi:MAG: Protein of unknown function (DUF2946) [Rhodobacteraceae bacterium HLUCCO07]|nr:MAG: Protein of unknown function (DUF2946) [Rhodobacteraceae bacterium HLUCCO07]